MPKITTWLGFLSSFYLFHEYSSQTDKYPFNGNYKYPSYVIAKEKIFRPLLSFDFDAIDFAPTAK
jgi:hypothetical protein